MPGPKNNRGIYYFISLKTGIRIHSRHWVILHVTKLVIGRKSQFADDEGINEMVDGEMLFELDPGEPIFLQSNYEEATLPLNFSLNEEPNENVEYDVIIFGEEERYITEEDG